MANTAESHKELDELKSYFLATLNHEMRTPLSGVLGMLDLLSETELNDEQREYVESSHSCAEHLLAIMNATLEYSALAANQVKAEPSEFRVVELLSRIVDEFEFRAKTKGLRLTRSFDSGLPESAIGDAVLLKQLLLNVLDNAVKFTRQGEVELSASGVTVEDGDLLLTVKIRDTGVGIAEDKLSCIFDPFRQLETGLARRYPGMGLGLAVTQKIAALLQAELVVESRPGEGSRFTVHVPLRFDVERDKKPGKSSRVLLFSPAPDTLRGAIGVLHAAPCTLDTVSHAGQAFDAATRNRYDLILIDLLGPQREQLTSRIRALPGYDEVPIVALTADRDRLLETVQLLRPMLVRTALEP